MIEVDLNAVSVPLRWEELFGSPEPPAVELGSGNMRFLLQLAGDHPEQHFLAVERAAKYHRLGNERLARHGLANVRTLRTTAEDVLHRLLAPASVAAFLVLFSDPWPKKRHHKRRLVHPDNVAAMVRTLQPGGRLLVKTDHDGYAAYIAEVLPRVVGLGPLDPASAFAALPPSGYELKFAGEREIHAFAYERTG